MSQINNYIVDKNYCEGVKKETKEAKYFADICKDER
jgi:hypothetical protein